MTERDAWRPWQDDDGLDGERLPRGGSPSSSPLPPSYQNSKPVPPRVVAHAGRCQGFFHASNDVIELVESAIGADVDGDMHYEPRYVCTKCGTEWSVEGVFKQGPRPRRIA